MADPVNTVKFKMAYKDTDFTRNMTISEVADSVLSAVEGKIEAINSSLAGGTAGGLETFFISDDYDADASIGSFAKITEARIESVVTTPIPLGG